MPALSHSMFYHYISSCISDLLLLANDAFIYMYNVEVPFEVSNVLGGENRQLSLLSLLVFVSPFFDHYQTRVARSAIYLLRK